MGRNWQVTIVINKFSVAKMPHLCFRFRQVLSITFCSSSSLPSNKFGKSGQDQTWSGFGRWWIFRNKFGKPFSYFFSPFSLFSPLSGDYSKSKNGWGATKNKQNVASHKLHIEKEPTLFLHIPPRQIPTFTLTTNKTLVLYLHLT